MKKHRSFSEKSGVSISRPAGNDTGVLRARQRQAAGLLLKTCRILAAPLLHVRPKCFLPVFIFPRVPQNAKSVFVTKGENEKANQRHGSETLHWFIKGSDAISSMFS
jgi:hypothetical protein